MGVSVQQVTVQAPLVREQIREPAAGSSAPRASSSMVSMHRRSCLVLRGRRSWWFLRLLIVEALAKQTMFLLAAIRSARTRSLASNYQVTKTKLHPIHAET